MISKDRKSFAKSGLTLLETLLVSALFLLLSTLLILFLNTSRKATQVAENRSDMTSRIIILYEKLRNEFSGVRVVGNDTDQEIAYWVYQKVAGQPQFGQIHPLAFEPGPNSVPDVAFLRVQDEQFVKDFQGKARTLARLGEGGRAKMAWNPASRTLRINGRLEILRTNERVETFRDFDFNFSARNVE